MHWLPKEVEESLRAGIVNILVTLITCNVNTSLTKLPHEECTRYYQSRLVILDENSYTYVAYIVTSLYLYLRSFRIFPII